MIRIGTRQSKLALVQTELVKKKILKVFPNEEIVIVPIVTKGDRELEKSLASFGGKGVFTKEIEERLLDHTIDLAVHSAKDIPMEFPEGLALGAVVEREDPRDVLITRTNVRIEAIKNGVIGTSSLRRELQIKRLFPMVQVQSLRGNVPSRIEKLRNGQYDAIILAAAGLKRLNLDQESDLEYQYLDVEEFVPAAGQGILALELRVGTFAELMAAITNKEAEQCLKAEREFLKKMGGSCNAPCGVYAYQNKCGFKLQGMYARDGRQPAFASVSISGADMEGDSAINGLAEQLAKIIKKQRVSLVGAGPGKHDFISQKALECIQTADVILYDNLISPSLLNEARLDAKLIYVGKRADSHSMKQDDINQLLVSLALEGNYVVRLKGGDPFVFGRGGEEALALQKEGIPFDLISGISSVYSVPAYAGIPLTHRGVSASFHVITGHEEPGKLNSDVDYRILAQEPGTLVFLMGLSQLGKIANQLISNGKDASTPAAVIQNGTGARQKVVCGTLAEIEKQVKKEGLTTPAVIVIGNVVKLSQILEWQSQLPLTGKRILLTGTRQMAKQLEQVLEPLGAETICISLVETVPILNEQTKRLLRNLSEYSWLVFTSSNGVQIFFDLLRELRMDRRKLAKVRFATVGASTAEALAREGYYCDFIPSEYCSQTLAKEWLPHLSKKDKVLLIRAVQGSDLLEKRLFEQKIYTDVANIYETVKDNRRSEEVQRLIQDVDYIVLASGSAATALAELLKGQSIKTTLVAIGPVTRKICEDWGLSVRLEAKTYTAGGIAEVILQDQS